MPFLLLLLFSLTLSNETFAANACEELPTYTCSAGVHSDGTGSLVRVSAESISNDAILLKYDGLIQSEVLKAFRHPVNPFPAGTVSEVASVLKFELGGTSKSQNPNAEKIKGAPAFAKLYQNVSSLISKQIVEPAHLHLLQEKVFPELRSALLVKLDSLVADVNQRKAMKDKIKKIRLDNETLCLVDGRPKLYRTTARYDGDRNSLRVCGGSLGKNFSEFKLVHSVAHELSHSIDPCNIQTVLKKVFERYVNANELKARDARYPMRGLLTCLREDSSVGAKAFVSKGEVEVPEAKNEYFDYCDGDQVVEAFADWLGDELLADYIAKNHPHLTEAQWYEGASNIFRPNCNDVEDAKGDHPLTAARIERLLLVNPKIRAKLACKVPSPYRTCEIKAED